MTIFRLFVPLLLLAAVSNSGAQTSSLPQIRRNGGVQQLFVDNRPFLMLAGELHNSSASSVEYMKPIWPRLSAMHLNTVLAPISWALLEPSEGHFDYTLVDGLIRDARAQNLRLVLLWFGTWKNGLSSYAPDWVKKDFDRFPREVEVWDRTGTVLHKVASVPLATSLARPSGESRSSTRACSTARPWSAVRSARCRPSSR